MAKKPSREPSFDVGLEEDDIISEIADRIMVLSEKTGVQYSRMTALMDLAACHNSTPLRLRDLLNADDSNFAHDVWGIRRHMDRETGELGGCFLPRFARTDIDRKGVR